MSDNETDIKNVIMETPVGEVLGKKVKFINQRTRRVKTGTVYSIFRNAIGVAGADNIAYSVQYEFIVGILQVAK